MQTLKSYLYPTTVEVQIPDPLIFSVRKRTVYSHPIKIFQGTDNPIQIVINNQDNKPVDCTGYAVQVHLQDPISANTVANYSVTFANVILGQGSITVSKEQVDALDQRIYKLAVKRIRLSDSQETPAYSDANYTVPIDVLVMPGYYD